MLVVIIGLIATALLAGAVIYLGKLTIKTLKSFRQRATSKILAGKAKDLLKEAPTIKLDDLKEDDVIMAEYDEEADELVQDITISKDVDDRVNNILDDNDGIVIFE